MTLDELRLYYRLREYQISHLINAQNCHRAGKAGELNLYLFLLFWADAMYQADEIQHTKGFVIAHVFKSRGEL